MTVLSRTKYSEAQRLDLEDVLAEQSAARTDAKLSTQKFWSGNNRILQGFTVTGLGLTEATLAMANAALINPQNTTDLSWFVSSASELDITITASDLTDSVRNYVEIELCTLDGSPIDKAFWDPDANSGLGQEFTQNVNTVTDLKVNVVVLTGAFSGNPNRLPVAILDTDGGGVIKIILDQRVLYHRLETDFAWSTKQKSLHTLVMTGVAGTFLTGDVLTIGGVTATVVTGGTTTITFNTESAITFATGDAVSAAPSGASGTVDTISESFTGVDKDILTLEDQIHSLQTEIKTMKGEDDYWADAGGALTQLATFVGADDAADLTPDYFSNIRGGANEPLELRSAVLTDVAGDYQEDRSAYLRSDDVITWSSPEVIFTTDIVLEIINTKSGTITTHTVALAGSPISLTDGESAWVSIDRGAAGETLTVNKSGTLAVPAQTQADKDVFILFRRQDTGGGTNVLHIPLHKQALESGQAVRLGASGGGGGGGNGINYITNPGAEVNIADWDFYNDGSVAIPLDGTGGSAADLTFTRTTSGSELLRGDGSFKLAKDAADAQGEGVSFDFIIDPKDQGKDLIISLEHKNTANYLSGDLKLFIYDITNATIINVESLDGGDLFYHTGFGTGTQGRFQTAVDSVSYRFILHITSSNALAWDFIFDTVKVGPQETVPGAIVTEWVEDTSFTFNNVSITNQKVFTRRVGDSLEIKGAVRFSAAPSGTVQLVLPANYTPDSGKLESEGGDPGGVATQNGVAAAIRTSNQHHIGRPRQQGTTNIYEFFGDDGGGIWNATNPFNWVNTDQMSFEFIVPIEGFSSGASLATNEANLQTGRLRVRMNGAVLHTSTGVDLTILYDTVDDDTDNVWDSGGFQYIVPRDGLYAVHVTHTWSANPTTSTAYISLERPSVGTIEKINLDMNNGLSGTASTVVRGVKGDKLKVIANQGSGGNLQYGTDAGGNILVITPIPDFSTFSVFGENEFQSIVSSVKNGTGVVSGSYLDMVGNSVTLQPGSWVLHGSVDYNNNGSDPLYTRPSSFWSDANGTDTSTVPGITTHLVAGLGVTRWDVPTNAVMQMPSIPIRVIIATPQTIFLVPLLQSGAVNFSRTTTYIYAERIA